MALCSGYLSAEASTCALAFAFTAGYNSEFSQNSELYHRFQRRTVPRVVFFAAARCCDPIVNAMTAFCACRRFSASS